jgi:hypothetical protein
VGDADYRIARHLQQTSGVHKVFEEFKSSVLGILNWRSMKGVKVAENARVESPEGGSFAIQIDSASDP